MFCSEFAIKRSLERSHHIRNASLHYHVQSSTIRITRHTCNFQ